MLRMENNSIVIYILLGIITTDLIRILPITLIKGKIRNRFVRSVLYYVPYVTLTVMTFPAIMLTTMTPWSGLAAFVVGVAAAWRGMGLFPVAAICCAVVYLMQMAGY